MNDGGARQVRVRSIDRYDWLRLLPSI